MKTLKYLTIFVFISLVTGGSKVFAQEKIAATSAAINKADSINTDYEKELKLRTFLEKYRSPLAPYSLFFIKTAEKYQLDYALIPAIAGVESTFGKAIPVNSYNAYGWNNGDYSFQNWEEGIEVVGKHLRENYIDKWQANTIEEIAKIYCPPSRTWASKVTFFMNRIKSQSPKITLSI